MKEINEMLKEMTSNQVTLLKAMNANPEFWDEIAKTYKNAFDALTRAGFSPQSSIDILSRQGTGINKK